MIGEPVSPSMPRGKRTSWGALSRATSRPLGGAYQTAYGGGGGDAFVAKFSASGSALIYSTYLGGIGYEAATSIALDPAGNAYVAGQNYAAGFPTTPGANAYVTGLTISSDFPMQNASQPTFGGYYDAFVTKLNPAGWALVYSTYLGGIGWDGGRGITVDSLGNAYVAGQTDSNNFPTTPGAYQTTYGGNGDGFVAKINVNGSVVYSTCLGGSGVEAANAIAVDQSGNTYVTGTNLNGGFGVQPDLFLPASFESQRLERVQRSMVIIGRLRDGVSVAQARAEIAAITSEVARETLEGATPPGSLVNTIRDDLTGEFRRPFFLLQCAVGIMLLIACANVANLLLARYSARAYEFSVRTAVGASHGQMCGNSSPRICCFRDMGAIGGIRLPAWSLRPMLALVPAAAGLPFADQVRISPEALGFALGLSLLSSILFGLAPARQASRGGAAQHLGGVRPLPQRRPLECPLAKLL